MPRFTGVKDIAFFEHISSELVDDVVTTPITFYKLSVYESRTNLYGESLGKTYHPGIDINCLIERQESEMTYEGFGYDRNQSAEYRFNRFTLEDKKLYPEIGDIIFHNNAYFEIDNVRQDQMLAGRQAEKFSIICNTFMVRRSAINIEERAV